MSQFESKPNSPDYTTKQSLNSPDVRKPRQTVRHGVRRNFPSQHRTDTAQSSIDRRQFILSQGGHGRGMLESPKGPTIMAPTSIIEKMIQNRNRVATRGYEAVRSRLGYGKKSLHIETVTNSDIYLNSAFSVPARPEHFISAASARTKRVVNMKGNNTGRSVNGCGAYGRSTSPCSHSGMDPDLARGKSSQLDFDMIASDQ